ncbi:MAG: efflux RND transporter permease subunit [Candidatus Acidiferrales bacterium]
MIVRFIGLIVVYLWLLFEFKNLSAPAAISSAILSTSGVFIALLLTATTFNISSFMGLIMVVGIISKNGILLLDADRKFRTAGEPPKQARIEAGAPEAAAYCHDRHRGGGLRRIPVDHVAGLPH